MSGSRPNPFKPSEVSSTLLAFSGIFLGTSLFEAVKKMPDVSDTSNFEKWIGSFKEWLSLYIRNTQDGLLPIGDIERKMELIDVLKASLPKKEGDELDPLLTKLKENFQKVQQTRDAIKQENNKFNDSLKRSGSEAIKMTALQPEMALSHPITQILKHENESERLLRLSVTRARQKEEELRIAVKNAFDTLSRRVTPEKARELEEKSLDKSPGIER